jgi:hypothetical protein
MERTHKIVKKDRKGLDAVRRPTAIEVAWAAGIYEGEGSCVTNHSDKGYESFVASVNQKDPELLYRMRDLFGGTIILCNRKFNGKIRPIYHWKVCGDRARTFVAVIYPFLTSRRKEQIESTPAGHFIELAQDLLHFDTSLGQSQVYDGLWNRIYEYDAEQRQKAREHKKQRAAEWRATKGQEPEYKERKRLYQQERRRIKKEQLKAGVTNLVAIA